MQKNWDGEKIERKASLIFKEKLKSEFSDKMTCPKPI